MNINSVDGRSMRSVNPSRIRTGREYRGFSKTELASVVGITVQALTNYEQGVDKPRSENLAKLAAVLRFDEEYFLGSDFHDIDPELVTFRSRRSLTAKIRRQSVARSKHASDIISPYLNDRFKLPDLDLPDLNGELPEVAAELLRSTWNLGQAPIDNMVHLLESKGIEIYWLNIDSPCVDALSYWIDGSPFIFLNSFKEAGERARFDVAHELAHLILHRNTEDVQSKEVENEADRFASSFLLPASQFRKEVPNSYMISDFLTLKPRWKTSIQAMVRRSYDLGLMSRYVYEQSCRTISARGWRKKEPHELVREQSAMQYIMLEKLFLKEITPNVLANEMKIQFTDFFELVPSAIHFAEDQVIGSK